MTKLHTDILSPEQMQLLPFIRRYRKSHFLVGGTALALQLGHRRSIDFDHFSSNNVMHASIMSAIKDFTDLKRILVKNSRELTLYANKVKLT